jgi:hypothetical protein
MTRYFFLWGYAPLKTGFSLDSLGSMVAFQFDRMTTPKKTLFRDLSVQVLDVFKAYPQLTPPRFWCQVLREKLVITY